MCVLSSSDVVTDRGVRENVLRPFRPDYYIRPQLRIQIKALVDAEPVQVCLRRLLIDDRGGPRNAPNCDDVGYLPAHPGNFTLFSP